MVNVVVTSGQLREQLQEVVARTNEKIKVTNALPASIRDQMDMEVFDDIEFLLKYITSLHAVMADIAEAPEKESAFEF